jgi:hypothetical protein
MAGRHRKQPGQKTIPKVPHPDSIKISKLDAARRQLRTAIRLWFYDGDPVSTHALAFAAYEIIDVIRKQRSPDSESLFDLARVKPEYRAMLLNALKEHANFFKHGGRDPAETIAFHPDMSEIFILLAASGLSDCGEALGEEESAFLRWTLIHKPNSLNPDLQKLFHDSVPVETLHAIRRVPKGEFLEQWFQARALLARQRQGHF